MEQFDHLEVAQEAATILKAGDTNKAASFLRKVASDFGGVQAFAADLREEKEFYAEQLSLPVADIEWMACTLEGNAKPSKYVVVNENTLCYRIEGHPEWLGVLHGSVLRGGRHWMDGPFVIGPLDKLRDATLEDFHQYRVSPEGHPI